MGFSTLNQQFRGTATSGTPPVDPLYPHDATMGLDESQYPAGSRSPATRQKRRGMRCSWRGQGGAPVGYPSWLRSS